MIPSHSNTKHPILNSQQLSLFNQTHLNNSLNKSPLSRTSYISITPPKKSKQYFPDQIYLLNTNSCCIPILQSQHPTPLLTTNQQHKKVVKLGGNKLKGFIQPKKDASITTFNTKLTKEQKSINNINTSLETTIRKIPYFSKIYQQQNKQTLIKNQNTKTKQQLIKNLSNSLIIRQQGSSFKQCLSFIDKSKQSSILLQNNLLNCTINPQQSLTLFSQNNTQTNTKPYQTTRITKYTQSNQPSSNIQYFKFKNCLSKSPINKHTPKNNSKQSNIPQSILQQQIKDCMEWKKAQQKYKKRKTISNIKQNAKQIQKDARKQMFKKMVSQYCIVKSFLTEKQLDGLYQAIITQNIKSNKWALIAIQQARKKDKGYIKI